MCNSLCTEAPMMLKWLIDINQWIISDVLLEIILSLVVQFCTQKDLMGVLLKLHFV